MMKKCGEDEKKKIFRESKMSKSPTFRDDL